MAEVQDMAPAFASLDSGDGLLPDAVGPSDLGLRTPIGPDSAYLVGVQARVGHFVAHCLSALRLHIGVIVGFRPEKKMRGVEARRVVAAVEDADSLGQLAAPYNPRKPMNRPEPSSNPYLAVTATRGESRPLPLPAAIVRYLAARKELLFGRKRHLGAFYGAVTV